MFLSTTRPPRARKKNKMSDKHEALKKKFKVGDWVFGIAKHKGCSEVFEGYGQFHPFDYLNDFDPDNFRLATAEEIKIAKGLASDGRSR